MEIRERIIPEAKAVGAYSNTILGKEAQPVCDTGMTIVEMV